MIAYDSCMRLLIMIVDNFCRWIAGFSLWNSPQSYLSSSESSPASTDAFQRMRNIHQIQGASMMSSINNTGSIEENNFECKRKFQKKSWILLLFKLFSKMVLYEVYLFLFFIGHYEVDSWIFDILSQRYFKCCVIFILNIFINPC